LRSHADVLEGAVIRRARPYAGLLFAALIALSACDSQPTTTPTPPPAPPPPTPAPAPAPTPPPTPAALESITLNPSTVPSQSQPTATVKLTAPAPAGNAAILLETNNPDVAKVPSNISIAAGETTATFRIETSTVRISTTVVIEAKYLGVAARADLVVTPPGLNANFRVVSQSRGEGRCVITTAAGAVDCVLDASTSTGFVSNYRWTLALGSKELVINQPDGVPAFTPATTCDFLAGGSVTSDGLVLMVVTLQLRDRDGNTSNATEQTVGVVPNGMCGY
jgi:hypothetical protein